MGEFCNNCFVQVSWMLGCGFGSGCLLVAVIVNLNIDPLLLVCPPPTISAKFAKSLYSLRLAFIATMWINSSIPRQGRVIRALTRAYHNSSKSKAPSPGWNLGAATAASVAALTAWISMEEV
jgi:hypothetical protein